MSRVVKAFVFVAALMVVNVGIAFGAHWEAFEDYNAKLCFEQTEKAATGADPETLGTLYCTRALKAERLSREDRSAILFNRGLIQKAQGNLAAAQASFEQAVRLSRTTDRRNLALAEVARELGDVIVAFEQYDLLAKSAFASETEDLRAAVFGRREEAETAYFASVERGQACVACHGADGISANPEIPTLSGRQEDYLEHALQQFKSGQREDAVMAFQATLIADKDILVLARYFSSLDALESTRID